MSYTPTDQEKALRAWIVGVLGEDVPVIYSRQVDAPLPDGAALVTLYVLSEKAPQHPHQTLTDQAHSDGDFIITMGAQHSGRLQVDIYGAGHREMMRCLVDSLHVALIQEINAKAGVAVSSAGPLQDVTALAGQRWEGRTMCEFLFTWQRTTEHRGAAVESISTTEQML